ncbi:MAG TPA: hypothetical protein VK807_01945 [Gemmatimonadaceae bacterium]|nr:hypothetical protein [Gemmatimonadaceae bacterium]
MGSGPGGSGAHQIVRFQSVLDSGTYRVLVEPLAGGPPSSFVAETTDASGRAAVVIALGNDEGPGQLVVSVPALGYLDTARYTVLPGNPYAMQTMPNDTAAYIGGTVGLRTSVVDRFGNTRTDPVAFVVISGPGSINGSTLIVNSYGPIRVAGKADGFADTTTVYGVPKGIIAAAGDVSNIWSFNLDGSAFTPISTVSAGTLKWAPNGSSLVFDQTVGGLYGASDLLQSVTAPGGQVATIVNSGATALAYPQYSRDGTWIYYDEFSTTQPIWRVHPDGTDNATVNMVAPEGLQFPSPSFDGTKVSYILGGGAGNLKVLTLSSGIAVDLGVKGIADVWSPTGNAIAYVTLNNAMALINSDGSGQSAIAPGPYGPQFDWSPDGQWIIARNTATTRLELINVATQLVISLGYTGTVGSPTWH